MNKLVLVVDDFGSTRKVIESGLKHMGLEVIGAENGMEAKRLFDGRKIDLLITDLNMPEMDGAELTRFVRATNTYFRIPILLLTTEIKKEKKDMALEAGVTAILNKPYVSEDFNRIIKRLLKI